MIVRTSIVTMVHVLMVWVPIHVPVYKDILVPIVRYRSMFVIPNLVSMEAVVSVIRPVMGYDMSVDV